MRTQRHIARPESAQPATQQQSFRERGSFIVERAGYSTLRGDRDAGAGGGTDAGVGVAPAAPPGGAGSPPASPGVVAPPVVTLPAHIRHPSSPAGMNDRIPPRVDTSVAVTISGLTRGITLSIEGAGGGNGSATISGAATTTLLGSATVPLRGVDQTAPGNGGNLRLAAHQGTTLMARSAGFSVAAIPRNWSISFNSLRTGANRGVIVNDSWVSDSGVVADLNETEISEEVQSVATTGIFAGSTLSTSGFLPGDTFTTDTHGTTTAALTGPGEITLNQTSQFNDKRSGSSNIPMTNSGYRILHRAFRPLIVLPIVGPVPGPLMFLTSKTGMAVTANGVASTAGAGSVTRTQVV